MTKHATSPLIYNPANGLRFIAEHWTADAFRKHWPEREWIYNPWTGKTREPDDVIADPLGQYVAVPAPKSEAA